MSPAALLDCLKASGFTVRVDGERLMLSPASLLTPELRSLVTAHKPSLLALLAVERPPTPVEMFIAGHSPLEAFEMLIQQAGGTFKTVPAAEYVKAMVAWEERRA